MEIRSRDSYLPTADQRNTRIAFAVFLWGLIVALTLSLAIYLSPTRLSLAIGIVIALNLIAESTRFVLVAVPEYTALLLINYFAQPDEEHDQYANLMVLTSGLHPKFPWDQVKEENFIDLRVIEQPYDEDFISKDNIPVNYSGTIFFQPLAERLPRYLAFADTTIKVNLLEILTGYYTGITQSLTAQECREHQGKIREGIPVLFGATGGQLALEEYYGLNRLKPPTLGDVTYEESYQKAITNQTNVDVDSATAQRLRAENPGLTAQAAMDFVQVRAGIVKRTINDINSEAKGGEAFSALASLLHGIGTGKGA